MLNGAPERLDDLLAIIGVYVHLVIIKGAAEAAGEKSVDQFKLIRPFNRSGLNVIVPGSHPGRVECQAQLLFTFPQRLLSVLALGDVADEGAEVKLIPKANGSDGQLHRKLAPITVKRGDFDSLL